MKRKKTIVFVITLLLSSFIFSGCFSDRLYSFEKISNFVIDNKENLDNLINDYKGFNKYVSFDYEKYLGSRTIVKDAYSYTPEIIRFSCGGTGLVSDSKYCGFYYSENDMSYGMEFNESPQTSEEDGYVIYHNDDGISYVKTKRICSCWFYYYMEWH